MTKEIYTKHWWQANTCVNEMASN